MVQRVIAVAEHRVTLVVSLLILAVLAWPHVRSVAFLDRTPPVTKFHRAEVMNSPVAPGGRLTVRTWRDKARGDCPVTVARYITSEDGEITNLSSATWIGGSPDALYIDMAYHIPASVVPGFYALQVNLTYTCPGGLVFEYDAPPARFRVADGDVAPVAEQLQEIERLRIEMRGLTQQVIDLTDELRGGP